MPDRVFVMHPQCFSHLILGVFVLCVVEAVDEGQSNVADIVDKMCELVCHQMGPCSLFVHKTCVAQCSLPKIKQPGKAQHSIKATYDQKCRSERERDKQIQCQKSPPGILPQLTTEEKAQCRDNALHTACRIGDLENVRNIVSQGLEGINCRGYKGRTPVMMAARKRQVEIFDYLVMHGCDLSITDYHSDTILHVACKGGSVDIVRKLIDNAKYDIESRGKYGWTPVMVAAYNCREEVFDYLVSQGCDLSITDNDHDTVLHIACMGGSVDIVRKLTDHAKHDVEGKGRYGRTPVMMAACYGQKEVFDFLMTRGCNMRAVDDQKDNILHWACYKMAKNRNDCQLDMVKYILSLDVLDIESCGYKGRTPVFVAASRGCSRVVKLLVEKGCNLKALDDEGNAISHLACKKGADVVKYLMQFDFINWKKKNHRGQTPIQMASSKNRREVAALLG